MNIFYTSRIIVLFVIVFVSIAGFALAHKGATGIVKERMDAMTDISTQMKLMKKMIRGKKPYHAERFEGAATSIAKHGQNILKLFPKGSIDKPSRVKLDIWQDWEEFSALTRNLTENAKALADKAKNTENKNALRTDFRKLAKTCKSCHRKFRNKK